MAAVLALTRHSKLSKCDHLTIGGPNGPCRSGTVGSPAGNSRDENVLQWLQCI